MKLSDFMVDMDLGRVVAYHPNLKKVTRSTTATILLDQFLYWSNKTRNKDPEGWIWKTSDELQEETGLTYNEQKTAREKLIELKLIEEENKFWEHTLAFRVNLNQLNKLWDEANGGRIAVAKEHEEELKEIDKQQKEKKETSASSPRISTITGSPVGTKAGDLIDAQMAFQVPPEQIAKEKIRQKLEMNFHINTDTAKWRSFISYVYTCETKNKQPVEQFIDWALEKGFDALYWTPEKCKVLYPQAFVEKYKNKPIPENEFCEKLPEIKEEKSMPMPKHLGVKRILE